VLDKIDATIGLDWLAYELVVVPGDQTGIVFILMADQFDAILQTASEHKSKSTWLVWELHCSRNKGQQPFSHPGLERVGRVLLMKENLDWLSLITPFTCFEPHLD
jgi:hypothetical protein